MSILRKILWGTFVAIAGLFSGLMVERGLKSVYDPNNPKETDTEDKPEEAADEETTTNCAPSVPESETEKGDDESKSNEE